jgi:SagB-type dehydrogenase family enzyme
MNFQKETKWVNDPRPRATPAPYIPFCWSVTHRVPLEPGSAPQWVDLADILTTRRSHRQGISPAIEGLGALLWQVSRTTSVAPSPYGFELERRPIPSAGALHPIHILLRWAKEGGWCRYDPRSHHLEYLADEQGHLVGLAEHALQVAEATDGVVLAFVAEPGRTASKYENSESLVWRDAGVLQGALCAVAPALGLQVCLLGPTGDAWISRLANERQLRGTGLAHVTALK